MSNACAPWASPSPSAMPPTISKTPMPWSIPRRSSPAMSSSMPRARCPCRWCAAPKCWPRSCGCGPASPSPAPTARPPPPPWWRRCWMRGGMDPTVVNGGIINAYGTNARLGAGEWVVVEADESDGTFLRLPATVAVVTNADPDHLDFYGTFDAMREPSSALSRMCPSMASPCSAWTIPKCRRWWAASPTAASSPMASAPRPMPAPSMCRYSEGVSHFDVVFTDRRKGARRGWTVSACPCRAIIMSRTPWPRSWWRASWASRRCHPQGAGGIQGRGPPLLQDRGMEGRRHH